MQQGGSKALIPMALDGTDKGTRCAAQALARIGITQVGELFDQVLGLSLVTIILSLRTNRLIQILIYEISSVVDP